MGKSHWHTVPMSTNVTGRATTFVAAIPASAFASGEPVEYYVEAGDGTNSGRALAHEGTRSVTVLDQTGSQVGGVKEISVQKEAESTLVSWSAAEGPAFTYRVYRGSDAEFTPGPDTYLTYVTAAQREFRDVTAKPGGTYVYKVVPVTVEGNNGPASPPGV